MFGTLHQTAAWLFQKQCKQKCLYSAAAHHDDKNLLRAISEFCNGRLAVYCVYYQKCQNQHFYGKLFVHLLKIFLMKCIFSRYNSDVFYTVFYFALNLKVCFISSFVTSQSEISF